MLVVTHLAQVAAAADAPGHRGEARRRRPTPTGGSPIDGDARVDEFARMLSGDEGGAAARQHAAQLLDAGDPGPTPAAAVGWAPVRLATPGNRTSETEAPMARSTSS